MHFLVLLFAIIYLYYFFISVFFISLLQQLLFSQTFNVHFFLFKFSLVIIVYHIARYSLFQIETS